MSKLKEQGLDSLDSVLIGADKMLPNLKSVYLDSDQTRDIRLGKKIEYLGLSASHKLKLYDNNKEFLGIGESNTISEILPKRLFVKV